MRDDDIGDRIDPVTPEAIEIRLPTVEWAAPYSPEASDVSDGDLVNFVETARQKRHDEFVPCHYCRKPTPPEHRHTLDGKNVCHGCAERHEGVVH